MCHYDQATVPVPDETVVTFSVPKFTVDIDNPLEEIVKELGYLKITIPDPPFDEGFNPLLLPPPPPPPVFEAPAVDDVELLAPCPPPPAPPAAPAG
jgi:hypothetical protein